MHASSGSGQREPNPPAAPAPPPGAAVAAGAGNAPTPNGQKPSTFSNGMSASRFEKISSGEVRRR